jgi:hypothetical protein
MLNHNLTFSYYSHYIYGFLLMARGGLLEFYHQSKELIE